MADINASDLQPIDTGVINASDLQRVPDTMDYLLPTGLSRLIHGSPAGFGTGLNSTNMWGDLNRPAQVVREAILSGASGQNPVQGALNTYINPNNISTSAIQNALLKNATPKTQSVALNFLGGLPASTAGVIGDSLANLANPANALASLLAPGIAKSKVGQFSPDRFVIDKTKPLLDKLIGADIQNNYVPAAEKIYQQAVTDFTPQIQDFAANKVGVPQDIIEHISNRTPSQITASSNAMGDSQDTVFQMMKNGIEQKNADVGKAYENAWASVPNGTLIKVPKTAGAARGFLLEHGMINPDGSPTDLAKSSLVNRALSNVYNAYSAMQPKVINSSILGENGSPLSTELKATVEPTTPTVWGMVRNFLSDARNSDQRYSGKITKIIDALHTDAEDAGVPIQGARDLAQQNFSMQELAKKFIGDTGENKLNNIFKLTGEQTNNLKDIQTYIGNDIIGKSKDIAANSALNNIYEQGISHVLKPSFINQQVDNYSGIMPQNLPKAIIAGNRLKSLLGNNNPQLNNLLSQMNQRRLLVYGGLGTVGYLWDKGKKAVAKANAEANIPN